MRALDKIKNKINNFLSIEPSKGIQNTFYSFFIGCLGMCLVYFCFRNNNQIFTDVVLDFMGMRNGNKAADFYAWGAFFTIYITSYLILNKTINKNTYIRKDNDWGIFGIYLFLLFWGIKTYGIDRNKTCIIIVVLGLIHYLHKRKVNGKFIFDALCGIYCIYLSLSGIVALIGYIIPRLNEKLYYYNNTIIVISVVILSMGYLYRMIHKDEECKLENYLIQLFIPLNLLSIIGVDYWYRGERVVVNDYKKFTLIVVSLCIILIIFGGIQYKIKAKGHRGIFFTLPSILSYGIIVFWDTGYNLIINQDPYHVGETATVWKQIVEVGQKWGDEFVSVMQGLGFIISAINEWIFEGNIATYVQAGYILMVIAVTLLITALYSIVENKAILISVIPLLPFFIYDRMYLIIWVYIFLINPNFIKQPIKWTYCYILTCVLHIFYQPTYGGVVAFSLVPVLIFIWYTEHKYNKVFDFKLQKNRRIMLPFIISCALIAIICFPMLKHALQFLSYNGYETQNANGILFEKSFEFGTITLTNNGVIDMILFIFAKFGTGLLTFCMLIYFYTIYVIKDYDKVRKIQGTILTLSVGISYLMMTPAVLTRIDGGLSRIGIFSCIYLCGFTTMLLYLYRNELHFKKLAVLLLGVIGCTCIYVKTPDYFTIHKKAVERVEISDEILRIDDSDSGLSNWGDVFMTDTNYLHEAMTLNDICKYLLEDNQTYLDVTDQPIYYNFTNRRVPGVYASTYNLYNSILQEQTLEKLITEDCPIIFISKLNCAVTSLRSYRIYRYFMLQNYNFVIYKNVNFMIRDDVDLTPIENDISYVEYSIDTVQSINNIFHIPDLQYLASEWRSSWKNMEERFKCIYVNHQSKQQYTVDDNPVEIQFSIEDNIAGESAEFLRVLLKYSDSNEKRAYVKVRGYDKNNQSFEETMQFISEEEEAGGKSELLIPIAASPQCLRANKISEIVLIFEPKDTCYDVVVDEIELYSLIN